MGVLFSKFAEWCSEDILNMDDDLENVHIEVDDYMSIDISSSSEEFEEPVTEEFEEPVTEEFEEPVTEELEEPVTEDYENSEKAIFTLSNEKRALVIGINYNEDEYQNNDLNGCVNDINNIVDFLYVQCFFMSDDIDVLSNSDATRKNIEHELFNLVVFSHENPGSEIWVSYSGHGSNKISFTEEDLKSEVICPSDYATNGMITDSWIQDNFVKGLEKTTKVFVLMDCCNSGSNLNLPYRYKFGDITTNDNSYSNEELENLCNIVKISGCEDDQTSADYYDRNDNEFQGALTNSFTYFRNDTDKSIVHFYNNILSNLTNRGFTQRPVLSFSRASMLNSKLCT
jgi:hypothetical protein